MSESQDDLNVPSSSVKCPLGFDFSLSAAVPGSDCVDVEVDVEEGGWCAEGTTLLRLISLRTSLMVFFSSLRRLLREGLDFMAQVRSSFSRSCCSCLSGGRCSRLAGTSSRSTEERAERFFFQSKGLRERKKKKHSLIAAVLTILPRKGR